MATAEIRALHKDFESNLVPMLLNLAAVAVAIASLASGWPTDHWLWTAGVIASLVYFQHCWMTIFHEDVHYTLYQGKWHNIRNGMIVGTLLGLSYIGFDMTSFAKAGKPNSRISDVSRIAPSITTPASLRCIALCVASSPQSAGPTPPASTTTTSPSPAPSIASTGLAQSPGYARTVTARPTSLLPGAIDFKSAIHGDR